MARGVGVAEVMARLRAGADSRAGAAKGERFGITGRTASTAYGWAVGDLQKLAAELRGRGKAKLDGKARHALAAGLWETGQYEARLLACFVDDPAGDRGADGRVGPRVRGLGDL